MSEHRNWFGCSTNKIMHPCIDVIVRFVVINRTSDQIRSFRFVSDGSYVGWLRGFLCEVDIPYRA